MIVHEINDSGLVKQILCHPDIYPCISDDESPESNEYNPPMLPNIQYIGGFVDGDIIGLMIYHQESDKINTHIQVIPEYRKQYAKDFARMALTIGKAKNAILYAEIPSCFPNVKRFSESFGFKEIGIKKNGCKINGLVHDVAIMRLENGIR